MFDQLLLYLVAQSSRSRGSGTVMPPKVNRTFRYRRGVRRPAYRWAIFSWVDTSPGGQVRVGNFYIWQLPLHAFDDEMDPTDAMDGLTPFRFFSRFPARKTRRQCHEDWTKLIYEGALDEWTSRPCRIVDFGRPRPREPTRGVAHLCAHCRTYHVDRPCAALRWEQFVGRRVWVQLSLREGEPDWENPQWQTGH